MNIRTLLRHCSRGLTAVAVVFCNSTASAQDITDTALTNTLQRSLQQLRNQFQVQGMSAAAVIPGKGVWRGVTGDSHPGTPIDSSMLFGIASVTKTFIAAEVLKLVETGAFSLDDSIGNLLPPRAEVDPHITVRQLLNHTSGMGDYLTPAWQTSMFADPHKVWGLGEPLDSFLTAADGPPGSAFQYTNANYTLLGLIIEAATGDSLHRVLRRDLLQPLNLNNTYMRALEQFPNRIPHNWISPDMLPSSAVDSSSTPQTALWSSGQADGGLFSSAADLVMWGQQLYSGKVLSAASLTEMLSFRTVGGSYFNGYGLGVMRFGQGSRTYWGHPGNYYGFAASMLYHPPTGCSLALLINQDCISPYIAFGLMNTLLNRLTTSAEGTAAAPALQCYPNPAHEAVRLEIPTPAGSGECRLTMRDQCGRVVLRTTLQAQSLSLPVADYPRGLYFLSVAQGETVWHQKLVLE